MSQTSGTKKQEPTRRDFLVLTSVALSGMGAAACIWPFIDSMNPAQDTQAMASIDVDISSVKEGQAITVMWQGKPVFVRHRTPKEIQEAKDINPKVLLDPEPDEKRVKKPQWLIVVGVCTHLGCVPLGQKPTEPRGKYGGWFCPCHGSEYDTSGRVCRGPAPTNLVVPPYEFTDEMTIKIG